MGHILAIVGKAGSGKTGQALTWSREVLSAGGRVFYVGPGYSLTAEVLRNAFLGDALRANHGFMWTCSDRIEQVSEDLQSFSSRVGLIVVDDFHLYWGNGITGQPEWAHCRSQWIQTIREAKANLALVIGYRSRPGHEYSEVWSFWRPFVDAAIHLPNPYARAARLTT